eukprot:TRINITY_DN48034_c0_g1_i1.p1 TRINITY_DN48034_c0_g1~~TRINITY_DN48034_c0_g1_i1.p1  ORF type:complete len:316 (-),score=40.81 TRINITY_DN48034_c0_g1_i1:242-1123(-)
MSSLAIAVARMQPIGSADVIHRRHERETANLRAKEQLFVDDYVRRVDKEARTLEKNLRHSATLADLRDQEAQRITDWNAQWADRAAAARQWRDERFNARQTGFAAVSQMKEQRYKDLRTWEASHFVDVPRRLNETRDNFVRAMRAEAEEEMESHFQAKLSLPRALNRGEPAAPCTIGRPMPPKPVPERRRRQYIAPESAERHDAWKLSSWCPSPNYRTTRALPRSSRDSYLATLQSSHGSAETLSPADAAMAMMGERTENFRTHSMPSLNSNTDPHRSVTFRRTAGESYSVQM